MAGVNYPLNPHEARRRFEASISHGMIIKQKHIKSWIEKKKLDWFNRQSPSHLQSNLYAISLYKAKTAPEGGYHASDGELHRETCHRHIRQSYPWLACWQLCSSERMHGREIKQETRDHSLKSGTGQSPAEIQNQTPKMQQTQTSNDAMREQPRATRGCCLSLLVDPTINPPRLCPDSNPRASRLRRHSISSSSPFCRNQNCGHGLLAHPSWIACDLHRPLGQLPLSAWQYALPRWPALQHQGCLRSSPMRKWKDCESALKSALTERMTKPATRDSAR